MRTDGSTTVCDAFSSALTWVALYYKMISRRNQVTSPEKTINVQSYQQKTED